MNANQQQNDGSSGNKMLRTNDWSSQFPNNAIQGVHQINLQMIEQNQNPNIIESNYVWVQQHQQQRLVGTIPTRTHQFALKLKIDFFSWFFYSSEIKRKKNVEKTIFSASPRTGYTDKNRKKTKKIERKIQSKVCKILVA